MKYNQVPRNGWQVYYWVTKNQPQAVDQAPDSGHITDDPGAIYRDY